MNSQVHILVPNCLRPTSAQEDGGHRRRNRTTLEEKLSWWNTFFLISCAFAVFNDPIFCYINAIDDEHKCITTDKKMAWAYICSRTFTDVFYLIDIFISKCGAGTSFLSNPFSTVSRIFVSLPISQVFVVSAIIHGRLNKPPFYVIVTPIQFVLRIYLIYGLLKKRLIIDTTRAEKWLKPILDFVPFILASHLFGAFWYHLVIHAQTQCWMSTHHQIYPKGFHFELSHSHSHSHMTCRANRTDTYYPGSNISRWDDLCPVKQADPKTFDYGIFFYALQSDVVSSRHSLVLRIFQSFWWGLRNLSSFGSNLNSSMNPWEILFSVLISISGMALFLVYLNARLQESQERSKKKMQGLQERSNKLILEKKTQLRRTYIDLWFSKYNIPVGMNTLTENNKDLKTVIMENIHKLEENSVLNVQNVVSILPIIDRKNIMCVLCFDSLKQVSVLEGINDNVLTAICHHLMPVTYAEDTCIVQEGKPIGKLLLINKGIAVTYSNVGTSCGCSRNKWLKKGDFYGKELLNWAFTNPSLSDLPISTRNVIALEKVEAFVIRATDLKNIFFKYWLFFIGRAGNASQLEQWEHCAASSILAIRHHRQQRTRLAAFMCNQLAGSVVMQGL